MDFIWAAKQLKKHKPVRRKAWELGCFAGNDGSLFWRAAHEETYNSSSVTCDFDLKIEDYLAKDWEAVTILPPHKWKVTRLDYSGGDPKYFNYEREAKAYIEKEKYGKWNIEKVSFYEKE